MSAVAQKVRAGRETMRINDFGKCSLIGKEPYFPRAH